MSAPTFIVNPTKSRIKSEDLGWNRNRVTCGEKEPMEYGARFVSLKC